MRKKEIWELEADHEERMREIEIANLKQRYREEEQAAKLKPKRGKKIEASKLMMAALILISFQIIIFAEWLMTTNHDADALPTLIGISASLTVAFASYSFKSMKQNQVGGITYELAMRDLNSEETDEEITVSEDEPVMPEDFHEGPDPNDAVG